MKTFLSALFLSLSLLVGTGCLYKVPIQQGNILKKEDIASLQVGMTKRQVALILGTPAIADPFHQDRWDYVNTSKIKGKFQPVKKLTIYFDHDVVTRIEDHYFPENDNADNEPENKEANTH